MSNKANSTTIDVNLELLDAAGGRADCISPETRGTALRDGRSDEELSEDDRVGAVAEVAVAAWLDERSLLWSYVDTNRGDIAVQTAGGERIIDIKGRGEWSYQRANDLHVRSHTDTGEPHAYILVDVCGESVRDAHEVDIVGWATPDEVHAYSDENDGHDGSTYWEFPRFLLREPTRMVDGLARLDDETDERRV